MRREDLQDLEREHAKRDEAKQQAKREAKEAANRVASQISEVEEGKK